MPKIQAEDQTRAVQFVVRIRPDIQEKIIAYGHFLDPQSPSSPGYILTECFKQVIDKDAEFAAFLKDFKPRAAAKPSRIREAKTAA